MDAAEQELGSGYMATVWKRLEKQLRKHTGVGRPVQAFGGTNILARIALAQPQAAWGGPAVGQRLPGEYFAAGKGLENPYRCTALCYPWAFLDRRRKRPTAGTGGGRGQHPDSFGNLERSALVGSVDSKRGP